MTLASFVALTVARRLGLRFRLIAQASAAATALSDVRRLLRAVIASQPRSSRRSRRPSSTLRFWTSYDYGFGSALWHGVFHSISAFNNAGFALWTDNLMSFVTDGWVSLTIAFTIICGGLGFPVWLELRRRAPALEPGHCTRS